MITYVDCRINKFQIEQFGEYDSGKLDIEGVQEVRDCPREIKSTYNVKIWVDDIRPVPEGYEGTKSVNETKALIEQIESAGGSIDLIDLDHDLGDYAAYGGDAIKILDYLVERETFYPIAIHTANPVGRANMERMIRRFWP
jgi:hypothetical protein